MALVLMVAVQYTSHLLNLVCPHVQSFEPLTPGPGMPAAKADMRIWDRIVEVEGTDVTRASADFVVTIFK